MSNLTLQEYQKHAAENQETDPTAGCQELQAEQGIKREQHLGRFQDPANAQHRQGDEPQDHHRPEYRAYSARAPALGCKQKGER